MDPNHGKISQVLFWSTDQSQDELGCINNYNLKSLSSTLSYGQTKQPREKMAGALIGQAFISASIQVLCDRIASTDFGDLFRQKKLDEPLLMKLKMTLLTLSAVLDDAEEKQISNPAAREWLDELKHAVLDAEDLLDEIDTEALRCKVEGEGQTEKFTNKVWNFFSTSPSHFYQSMNVEIQGLLRRLDDFVQQKVALGLTEVVARKVSQRTPTTSLIHEPFVYGRDEDKENLSKVLFSDDASEDAVSILTIVGMGGVGKTTLARALYNDDKVNKHFTLRSWACVSEDYDAIRVTKTLLESVTSKPCKMTDLNLLQVELREQLRGKKFLFVLDDLWNDNYSELKRLQAPFTSGARGSKVIVTTRSGKVASHMNNVPIQHLEPLSDEDCWMLLANHAFGNKNHNAHPTLEEIGKKIARKCNGLPLASETLGGLLRCQRDFKEWSILLNSSLWELPCDESGILPALRLSYHYLPGPLKRCFVYCSLFPKDYLFEKEDMVLLWMAEGFIPQGFNGKRMEEMARNYFDELVSRSLLQKSGEDGFTMHDLLNDLGRFMSGGFFLRLEERESQEVKRLRHLSYARGEIDAAKKFEPLNGAKCLRTFLPISIYDLSFYISKKFLHDLLPSLKHLRVLSLSRYQNVAEVPDSVGNLIHLRYLDLSQTTIVSLPGAVCTLYNLQTLLLSYCDALIELPADMTKLINLRTLTLAGCSSLTKLPADMRELSSLHSLDVSGTKIEGMPVEIGRLNSLRTLTDFVVGKYTGSSIGELRELQHLQGRLRISNLQNVVDVVDALEANLKNKKELNDLELAWGDVEADDSQKERDVLDKLQPSTSLEKLTIRFYGGTSFPNWLGSSNSISNIQFMCISDCKYCLSLPSFGQLPTLKELRIKRIKFVRTVGVEFYGDLNGASVIQPFRSLKTLEFEEMPEWEDWLPSPRGGQCSDFPCLQELRIRNCPKLRGYLPNRLPCLKTLSVSRCEYLHLHDEWASSSSSSLNMYYLYIEGCPGLLPLIERVEKKFLSTLEIYNFDAIQCLPKMKYLRRLEFCDCPTVSSLEFLSHEMMAELTSLEHLQIFNSFHSVRSFPLGVFPKLSTLYINGCENLESFSIEGVDQNLSHLNQLSIWGCPNLASFPDGRLPTPNLRQLEVGGCKNLKSFPERIRTLTALERLIIWGLPNLVSFAQGGLPPNLQYFDVGDCDKVKPSVEWGLQGLVSLKEFTIAGEICAPFLKEQLLLPTTLNGIRIAGLSSLNSVVDVKGLRHLASLHRLTIEDCPSLEFLPREGLQHLTALQFLNIFGCPSLEFLPAEGLLHLTSLQKLRIVRCPKLQFLPENGLPPSLSNLEIFSCSTLEKRYEDKTGEDWAKISHIPLIKIGKQVIISV